MSRKYGGQTGIPIRYERAITGAEDLVVIVVEQVVAKYIHCRGKMLTWRIHRCDRLGEIWWLEMNTRLACRWWPTLEKTGNFHSVRWFFILV
jgi:hypothetical protein